MLLIRTSSHTCGRRYLPIFLLRDGSLFITGHNANINNFSIVGREEHNLSRLIKESMFIRVNDPSLNKNIGKYRLPHVWDEVPINNIELKLK